MGRLRITIKRQQYSNTNILRLLMNTNILRNHSLKNLRSMILTKNKWCDSVRRSSVKSCPHKTRYFMAEIIFNARTLFISTDVDRRSLSQLTLLLFFVSAKNIFIICTLCDLNATLLSCFS